MKKKLLFLIVLIYIGISFSIPANADNNFTDSETGFIVESTNHNDHWNSISIATGITIGESGKTFSVNNQEIIEDLNYYINKGDTIYFRLVLKYYEKDDGYQEYYFKINGSTKFSDPDMEHDRGDKNTTPQTYYLDRNYSGENMNTSSSGADGYGYSSLITSLSVYVDAHGTLGNNEWYINNGYVEFRIVDTKAPSITSTGTHNLSSGDYIITADENFVAYSTNNGSSWTSVSSTKTKSVTLNKGTNNIKVKDLCGNASLAKSVTVYDDIAPSLTLTNFTTDEDTLKSNFSSNISASDNVGVACVKVSSLPSKGTLQYDGTNANTTTTYTDYSKFSYLPNSNYYGTDSISFAAYDTSGNSSGTKTMSITINPINDAPIASNLNINIDENTSFSGMLSGSDVDSGTLSYSKVSDPTHGTINIETDGAFTYIPNDYYAGVDSFTYKVNDGEFDSNTATVNIEINPQSGAVFGGISFNDGSISSIEDGTLTLEQTAVQGKVYLHLQVVDKQGNEFSQTYGSIDYDITPPTVDIIPKSDGSGGADVSINSTDNWELLSLQYQISSDGGNSFGALTDYSSDIHLSNIAGNNYIVKVIATDWLNNITEVTASVGTDNLFNDNEAPTVTFGTNGGTVSKSHYTTVNVTDNIGGSGVNTSALSYAFSTDGLTPPGSGFKSFLNGDVLSIDGVTGSYYLWVKVYDYAGNETLSKSNIFVLDNTPPTIDIDISSLAAKTRTITANITDNYQVNTKYASGNLDTIYFMNNGISFTDTFTISENGTYTIYVIDEAGNETIVSFKENNLINTAPTISVDKLESDWTNKDVTILVTANVAEGAELNKIEYSLDNGSSWLQVLGNTIILTENGEHILKIIATDNIGNVSNILDTNSYKIDKTAPDVNDTINFSVNGNNTPQKSHSTVINSTYIEEEGDIVNLVYNISTSNTIEPNTWNSINIGDEITIRKENGEHFLWAKLCVTDKAGNSDEYATVSNAFTLDNEPIDISISGNPTEWVSSAGINVTANEAVELKYKKGSFITSDFPLDGEDIIDNKFTITENGVYTIYAKDSAGNESVKTFAAYKLDSKIPTVGLLPENQELIKEDITVNFISSDEVNGSGIYKTEYQYTTDGGTTWTEWSEGNSYTFTSDGVYNLKVKATDNAGNESVIVTSGDYLIDKTLPAISDFRATTVNTDSITLEVTASDTNLSDLPYQFSINNSYTTESSINSYTYSGLEGNTACDFSARVNDNAGNIAESEEITIYTLASQPTLSIESTKEDMAVLNITSGINGIAPMYQVAYTDKDDNFITLNWSRNTKVILNNIKEGTDIIVKVRNEDGIENTPVSITNIDLNNLPVISINSNEDQIVKAGDKIYLDGIVTDTENGVVTVKANINSVEKTIDVDTSTTNSWNLEWTVDENVFDGTYENLVITAIDNAGNESTVTYSSSIIVDKIKPDPQPFTGDVIEGIVYNTDKIVKIETSSMEEGSKVQYSFDTISWLDYLESGINIILEGETIVYSKTIDKAGNESDILNKKVWIDKTKPVVGDTYPNPAVDTSKWYNENTEVLISFADNWTDGINKIEYKVTGSADTPDSYNNSTNTTPVSVYVGEYSYNYIHYKVADLGGNILTGYFGPYQVDKNPPTDLTVNVFGHSIDGFTISSSATDDLTLADDIIYYYMINNGDYTSMNPSNQIITGLEANTVYNVKVKAVDAAGNETVSPVNEIRTKALISNETISLNILSETSDGMKLEIIDSINDGNSGVEYKLIVVNENSTDLENPIFEGEYGYSIVKDISNLMSGNRYDIYVLARDFQDYVTTIKKLTIQKSAPPIITVNNDGSLDPVYKKTGDTIEISGYVSDSDDESIVVISTLDGVEKRTEIDTTSIDTTIPQSFTLSFNIDELDINDGSYSNIEIKAIDSKGSFTSEAYTGAFIVDTLGPAKPTISKSTDNEWSNKDVEITIADNGDLGGNPSIGIESYSYTVGENSPITGNGTNIDTFTITNEGETSISTYFTDSLGNVGEVLNTSVKIDRVDPILSINKNSVSWTNQEISIAISVEDSLSGIDKIYYTIDEDIIATELFNNEFIVSANNHTENITINTNGSYYVHFKAVDKAGNYTEQTFGPYQYDSEKPFIDFGMGVYAQTKQSHSFDVIVSDDVSNIINQSYAWSINEPIDDSLWTSFSNGDTLTINQGDGAIKLWIKAEDEAGNILVSGSTDVFLDNTQPTIVLTQSTNDFALEVDIKADVTDDNTGIDVVKWAEGTKDLEFFNSYDEELFMPYILNVDINGIYTVYARDKAGNKSINTITVTNIDKNNPVAEVSINEHDYQNTTYDVTLTFKDVEGLSKIAYEITQSEDRVVTYSDYLENINDSKLEKKVDVTINENGSNYIHYSVADIAGKEITGCFGPYYFDNEKPVLSFADGNDGIVYTEYINEKTINYYDADREFIGYEVSDNLDEDISNKIIVDDSQVNYDAIGTYSVSFDVTDSAGNIADTLAGSIVVRDTLPPYYLNGIDIEINENQNYRFTHNTFTHSDNLIDSSSLKELIITNLPSNGVLKNNGFALRINDRITISDINNNQFTYEPEANFLGTEIFTVVPVDEYDNVDMDCENTVTILINSVNNIPTLSNIEGQTSDAVFNIGTTKTEYENNEITTIVNINSNNLENQIEKTKNEDTISVPIKNNNNVRTVLNVQDVKNMQEKDLTLEIKTENAVYDLPAKQIDITDISNAFGEAVELSKIEFNITIEKTDNTMVEVVESAVKEKELEIKVPPMDFEVEACYKDKTYKVDTFNNYVKRKIEIPEDVEVNKITTAVIVEKDGSLRHVPTFVETIDGKYYAVINSVTNSTYTLIYNEVSFSDVTEEHWGKEDVEEMASRLIVSGKENGTFGPDEFVTRDEAVTTIVRALGLKPVETDQFKDVESGTKYAGYIGTGYNYKIVSGTSTTTFSPSEIAKRQDVIVMLYRANELLEFESKGEPIDFNIYNDYIFISDYAKDAVEWGIETQIICGKPGNTLAPLDSITRAELSAVVNRFLKLVELIE